MNSDYMHLALSLYEIKYTKFSPQNRGCVHSYIPALPPSLVLVLSMICPPGESIRLHTVKPTSATAECCALTFLQLLLLELLLVCLHALQFRLVVTAHSCLACDNYFIRVAHFSVLGTALSSLSFSSYASIVLEVHPFL